jgi:type IV fimbrial biogenesis protein FimT
MQRDKQCGFTLYEVLITLLVIGVVLALGLPNLSDFTRNSRVTGTANDLHGSIMLGRSEAARSKENITICASDDPMGVAACDGASFEDGWILFLDLDGDIERDAGAGENVLKAFPPVHEDLNIFTSNAATFFSFAPSGLGRGDVDGNPSLVRAFICDARGNVVAAGGNSAARALVVTPVGRSTVLRDTAQITAMGAPC